MTAGSGAPKLLVFDMSVRVFWACKRESETEKGERTSYRWETDIPAFWRRHKKAPRPMVKFVTFLGTAGLYFLGLNVYFQMKKSVGEANVYRAVRTRSSYSKPGRGSLRAQCRTRKRSVLRRVF